MDEETKHRWLGIVAGAAVGRLATRRPDDRIDLVPFVFAYLPSPGPYGRLVSAVDHKPKRTTELTRLANIASEPAVTVLVDHYDDDWSTLWWVRLRGLAQRSEVEAEREEALAALSAKYEPYRGNLPAGALLVMTITAVVAWSASGFLPGAVNGGAAEVPRGGEPQR